ncbi:MAG TPA: GMC family oxidoreductase [Mucilaginibacter sp.]|nr:GMC family oxidoreductase [Mucilaginibacter sp.]
MKKYDVVIIGAGVAGALIANELSKKGRSVLILEAGVRGPNERTDLVGNYLNSASRSLGSPYNVFPEGIVNKAPIEDAPNLPHYYDQDYNQPDQNKYFKSNYERRVGGSTWHWLGNCPRLLPSDFETSSKYKIGVDWPIKYKDLEEWYCRAEHELGVAGDHDELNNYFGAFRSQPFPMPKIWPSYSDLLIMQKLSGSRELWSEFNDKPLALMSTPQARNSEPYDGRPVCTGNSSCVPICPIGAKYDASVHTKKAEKNGAHLLDKAIVTRIIADESGKITSVEYQDWENKKHAAEGEIFVLAANAIESAKILLMSDLANGSDQVGRNLMDHPQGEGQCIVNEPVFPFRGPPTTSGIDKFRDGDFRAKTAAFRLSMGNDGGGRSNPPQGVLSNLANDDFGVVLRQKLKARVTTQFRISFLAEMLPSPDNRVTLSPDKDAAGIFRPRITFSVDTYALNSFTVIGEVMKSIFLALGSKLEDINIKNPSYLPAGHIMGTCRMGNDPKTSVVDKNLQCHQHPNLFIAGASVFPAVGSANPTITIAALSLRLASFIEKQFNPVN